MRIKTIKFTNLVFLCVALILVLLSVFSSQRINRQARASDEVSHTQLLKFKLNDAFSHLIKTETAQRGFILTGDTVFLYDYFLAQQQIPHLLSEIKSLVKNNQQQLNNFNTASHLFTTRLGYIGHVMTIRRNLTTQELDSMLVRGKRITDSLSKQIERMINTENYLLEQRMVVKQAEESRTSLIILLFSALSIAILVFSFFRIKTEMFNNNILEQKVQERTEQIRSANEILNKQNLELEKRNNELHSFTFIANHDLKEPLRKIELFVNRVITSNEPISASNKNLLAKTIESVSRMKTLLEDIFIYTVADSAIKPETTDLNKIAAAAITNLQEVIDEKEATIEYKNLPVLKGSPAQIEQVFTNLISNSLKYSKKETKPHIKIEAEKQNGTGHNAVWKIEFIDNGIGFDEKYKEKIFEMFQRLHLKNEYSGTGIGLSICKKIVENHQGSITARSNGDGAVFTILLPENRN